MPNKGKNRASKQSQLKKRRKNGTTNVIDSRPTMKASTGNIVNAKKPENASSLSTYNVKDTSTKTSGTSITSLNYPYLKGELIRIFIIAIVITLILISFTFIPL